MILIIPCYNEAERLNIESFRTFVQLNPEIELCFVNDGSADSTETVIKTFQEEHPDQIHYLALSENRGKAEAVRQGIVRSLDRESEVLGYWDADLATPLSLVPDFLRCFAENPGRMLVCGSRIQRMGSTVRRHWYRHYPGRVIATFISLILDLPFYDTQCGAKLFKRSLAAELFEDPFISSWLFDVELIARIIGRYGKKQTSTMIYELPLACWTDMDDSRITLSYLPKIPLELLKIYRNYRFIREEQSS